MKRQLTLSLFVVAWVCLLFLSLPARAETVTLQNAGGGTTEIITDNNGNEVQTTNRTEDGTITGVTQRNPATGETTEIQYVEGKPVSRTTVNRDGITTLSEILDGTGTKPTDVVVHDDKGNFVSHTTYTYFDGNVYTIDHYDASGRLLYFTSHDYDDDGNLVLSTQYGPVPGGEEGEVQEVGRVVYDENGNIILTEGQIDGINAGLPGAPTADTNTHITTDEQGNTVIVTHHPGTNSLDVRIIDGFGRIISLQYLHGGCYLGDECPLQHLQQERQEISVTPSFGDSLIASGLNTAPMGPEIHVGVEAPLTVSDQLFEDIPT